MNIFGLTFLLFISLMQSVNGAQFINNSFLLILFESASPAAVLLTVIFSLTSIYASL